MDPVSSRELDSRSIERIVEHRRGSKLECFFARRCAHSRQVSGSVRHFSRKRRREMSALMWIRMSIDNHWIQILTNFRKSVTKILSFEPWKSVPQRKVTPAQIRCFRRLHSWTEIWAVSRISKLTAQANRGQILWRVPPIRYEWTYREFTWKMRKEKPGCDS